MKTLTAPEGKFLTNADHGIIGKVIYLPDSMSEMEFTEIDEKQYQEIQEAKSKELTARFQDQGKEKEQGTEPVEAKGQEEEQEQDTEPVGDQGQQQ